MSLVIRIDVDRPYGRQNIFRQIMSRIGSDLYFPRIEKLGYLNDLKIVLNLLNQFNARAYILFRKCTLPSDSILELINDGKHLIGLHLENSRSYTTFMNELSYFEKILSQKVKFYSKHGSGKYKYGFHHYAPYEAKKYIEWGHRIGMKIFFSNLEDPALHDYYDKNLRVFPSVFWLEHYWRETEKYNIDWLLNEIKNRDVVLLFHPDNVTRDKAIYNELLEILRSTCIFLLYAYLKFLLYFLKRNIV